MFSFITLKAVTFLQFIESNVFKSVEQSFPFLDFLFIFHKHFLATIESRTQPKKEIACGSYIYFLDCLDKGETNGK